MLNTWVLIGRIFYGLSRIKTLIAHYAIVMTETHGYTYYQYVNTHTRHEDCTTQQRSSPHHPNATNQ